MVKFHSGTVPISKGTARYYHTLEGTVPLTTYSTVLAHFLVDFAFWTRTVRGLEPFGSRNLERAQFRSILDPELLIRICNTASCEE
jgi:hypothetical protein